MKNLIKSITYLLIAVLITSCDSCKKDKPEPPAGEANLVVALDPAPASTTTPVVAIGTSYDFRVKVESQMPAQGVDIQVAYRKDSDNAVVFTRSYTTTTSPQAVSITGIPFSQVGTVTVVTTSKTKSTNTVTKTFKLVRK